MIIISVVKGEQSGQRFECDEEVITLGRGPSNRITVEDPVVSWQHGQITLHDGQYIYRDLNSTNGSLIARGSRRWKLDRVVPEMTLEPGDKIMLGSTVLEASIAAPSVLRMFTTKALRPQRPGLPTAEVAEIEGIYNSLRSDRETLLAIYEMERRIHLELDPERIRDRVLEAVLTAFPNASSVSLATVEPGSLQITGVTSRAASGQEAGPVSHDVAKQALEELRAVCFEEVGPEPSGGAPRCGMCAPLWTGSEICGVLQVFSSAKPSCFSEPHLNLFTLFANRAAIALANADLNDERQRTSHFRELTDYLANELRCAATGLVEWLRPLEEGQFGELHDLQFEAVHTARLGAQMVSTMVTSMTDLAQLRDPDWVVQLEPVRLDKAAEVPLRLAREIASSQGISEPIYRPDPNVSLVMASPGLLQRVILNLLLFGMAWGEASVPVVLTSSLENGAGLLSVEWSGDQIPEKDREGVFDPETQARLWKNLGHRSVGIGLSFCKLATAKMGGNIWVDALGSKNALKLALFLSVMN
jgi:K+-sensing histidine kinase KdpD